MTVTYTAQVATSSHGFGCFWKLLFRWKGSIYKLIWHEFLVYCVCYFTCSLVYRMFLNEDQKRIFESVSLHIDQFINLIPMAFVLGFYVSTIMTRWWDMYITLPWPDSLAVYVSTNIHGVNESARVMRRTILRYVNLCFVITLSMISPGIKKRFPTMDHMVEMGLLTEQEQMIFEILNAKTAYAKYWLPLVWAGAIVSKARKEGRIRDDFAVKTIMDELNNFRRGCGRLLSYDFISVPLVYTQVVTLAVYTFFISTIMGRQFLDPSQKLPNHTVDLYVPWFTLLQFFFYMGWLKVAESLINPFGEDDDDFEVNALIDRNIVVSYLIVDEMHEDHPELIKDMFFDEVVPQSLPYTVASEHLKTTINLGSTAKLEVPEHAQEILDAIPEEEETDVNREAFSLVKDSKSKEDLSRLSEVKTDSLQDTSSLPHEKVDGPPGSPSGPPSSGLITPQPRRKSALSRMIDRITSATSRTSRSRVRSSKSIRTLKSLRSQPTFSSSARGSVAVIDLPTDIAEGDSIDEANDILESVRQHLKSNSAQSIDVVVQAEHPPHRLPPIQKDDSKTVGVVVTVTEHTHEQTLDPLTVKDLATPISPSPK